MKCFLGYLFILLSVLLTITSCTSSSSVNILIFNDSEVTVTNKMVEVPVTEIRQWLAVSPDDSLFLLNEKNEPVSYSYSVDRTTIRFMLPIAQKRSQKNYTLNTGDPALLDNLFAFRHQKIKVSVR